MKMGYALAAVLIVAAFVVGFYGLTAIPTNAQTETITAILPNGASFNVGLECARENVPFYPEFAIPTNPYMLQLHEVGAMMEVIEKCRVN